MFLECMTENDTKKKTKEGRKEYFYRQAEWKLRKRERLNGEVEETPTFQWDYDTCSTESVVLVIWTSAALSTATFCCSS